MTSQIPEWLQWMISFASGAVGVYVGLKVGIARLEVNYCNLREKVAKAEVKLEDQVGSGRCERLRSDCQTRIERTLQRIELKVDAHKDKFEEKLSEIAVFMARHHDEL